MHELSTYRNEFQLKRKHTKVEYKSVNIRNKSSQQMRKNSHHSRISINRNQSKVLQNLNQNQKPFNDEKHQSSHQAHVVKQSSQTQFNNKQSIDHKHISLTQHVDLVNPTLIKSLSEQSQKPSRHYLVSRDSKHSKQGNNKLRNYRYRRVNFSSNKDEQISKLSIGAAYNNQSNPININLNPNLTHGTSIYDTKRKTQRDQIISKLKYSMNIPLLIFLNKVQKLELQFITYALNEDYQNSAEVIISLLNYAVDLNLAEQFTITLRILADFYLLSSKVNQALFYYNETRQSALLLSQSTLLIESLIGIAKCCSKGNLEKQGITILKKALEYSWYYQKKEFELQIYDQIGQKYYHLGDLARAKKYHLRFINSIYESSDSAHKSLSKQRIKKNQQVNIQIKYNDLSILFLVHLKIPIRSSQQISPILIDGFKPINSIINNNYIHGSNQKNILSFLHLNQRKSIDTQNQYLPNNKNNQLNLTSNANLNSNSQSSVNKNKNIHVRDQFNINKKYFAHFQDMESWIKNIMKNWFFVQQMDEPSLSNDDWTAPLKLKKFAYIDFKLNQHLRKFTNTPTTTINKKSSNSLIQYKQSLDEKIQRKLIQPAMEPQWYQKMVQQIVRDHKNKLLNVRDAIRMRGYNKQTKPQIQSLKQIYNKFFDPKNLTKNNLTIISPSGFNTTSMD